MDDIAEGEGEEQEEQEDVDDQAMWRTSLARESSCSQNGTWTRLNQDNDFPIECQKDVRLVLKFASGVGTAYEPRWRENDEKMSQF